MQLNGNTAVSLQQLQNIALAQTHDIWVSVVISVWLGSLNKQIKMFQLNWRWYTSDVSDPDVGRVYSRPWWYTGNEG